MEKISSLVLIILFLAPAGCSRTNIQSGNAINKEGYYKITAEQAYTMMMELNNYILLDVRTPGEYRERRIEGVVLIPSSELEGRAETELPDKDSVIFVYCQTGRRSENAARLLARKGYTNIYDFGGINNWPYTTVGD